MALNSALPTLRRALLFFAAVSAVLFLQSYVNTGGANLMSLVALVALVLAFELGRRTIFCPELLQATGWVTAASLFLQAVVFWSRPPLDPNGLASVLLLTQPYFSWVLGVPALVVSFCRGAWVAQALAALNKTRINRLLAIGIGLVLLGASIGLRPETATKRLAIWAEAVQLWQAKPLTGWGLGSYPSIAKVEERKIHADNLPLTLLAEGGVLQLGAFVLLAVVVATRARHADPRAHAALLAWALHQLVDCTLWHPLCAFALGLLLAEVENVLLPGLDF